MSRPVLTINAGSSSLKLGLFAGQGTDMLARGHVDGIGEAATATLIDAQNRGLPLPEHADLTTHDGALEAMLQGLQQGGGGVQIAAIGHRVVHGGPDYDAPITLSEADITTLETLCPFAPLHQPHNLAGIRAAQAAFPGLPHIACFDTAFHRHHPWVSDSFALPRRFYQEGVRRYGFHGLSYASITERLKTDHPALAQGRVVVAHLGNGASMCAIAAGQSIASSMGFSALDGLPMGTRCGGLDPGVMLYLMDQKGMSAPDITDLLYRQSGLLGLSGLSHDMRVLLASNTRQAAEAIAYFVFRCQQEIGALAAAMGGIDALVFTGGIGEHAAPIRAQICAKLGWMGLVVDEACNTRHARQISPAHHDGATVLVIPTDEERVIAKAAQAALGRA